MMRILALETSTEYCSVALWQDAAIYSRSEHAGQKHSELLMQMLDDLLSDAGCRMRDVDCIAFGMGPGSFTGVRIACGTAQGLALGAALPVVGICTLEALAEASGSHRVIAALDARMGEIYHAAYQKCDEHWIVISPPCLCQPEQAPQLSGCDWFGTGSGFATHAQALAWRYTGQLLGVDNGAVPEACAVAALGAARFAEGLGADAALAQPLYLRDKVALKSCEREAAPKTGLPVVAPRSREMTQADIEAVQAIEQAVQPFPWSLANFSDALNSGYLCRVEESDRKEIHGYAILMPIAGEAELLTIGIAAQQQRKGLGRKMLEEMLGLAQRRNLVRVFLEVRQSNVAALALYRSAGFSETGLRRAYYRNALGCEDAVTMALELSLPVAPTDIP